MQNESYLLKRNTGRLDYIQKGERQCGHYGGDWSHGATRQKMSEVVKIRNGQRWLLHKPLSP